MDRSLRRLPHVPLRPAAGLTGTIIGERPLAMLDTEIGARGRIAAAAHRARHLRVIAWRICKRVHAAPAAVLSGEGAKIAGGRWNAVGVPLVYASDSSSLALLETLARAVVSTLPPSLVAVSITVSEPVPLRYDPRLPALFPPAR